MAICDRRGPIVESAVLECVQVRVVLTRSSALDRETQAEHRLRVTALDAGLPARTGQLDVILHARSSTSTLVSSTSTSTSTTTLTHRSAGRHPARFSTST